MWMHLHLSWTGKEKNPLRTQSTTTKSSAFSRELTNIALTNDVIAIAEIFDGQILQNFLTLLARQHLHHRHRLDQQKVAETVPLVEVLGGQHGHIDGHLGVLGHTHRCTALLLRRDEKRMEKKVIIWITQPEDLLMLAKVQLRNSPHVWLRNTSGQNTVHGSDESRTLRFLPECFQ